MRAQPTQRLATVLRTAMFAMLLAAVSGCSDILSVAGLSNLSGYWTGSYESGIDFYLDLDDDLYGVYGRAGFERNGERSDGLWVDGERNGSHIAIYLDDRDPGDLPLFEGEITGRDRIDGLLYLDILPQHVVLRRH